MLGGLLWLVSVLFVPRFIGGLQPAPFQLPGESAPGWLPTLLWIGWLTILAGMIVWAAYLVLDWSDHWIALTTRRLIIMDKALIFHETRHEAPLAKVQNCSADYPNALAVALDFGQITVDTAGVGVLRFNGLPRPKVMREAIFAQQAALKSQAPPPEDRRKEALRSILGGVASPGSDSVGPAGSPVQPPLSPPVTGHGPLNLLFPVETQRAGEFVIWHKHWIYLLRGVFLPTSLFLIVLASWLASALLGERGEVGVIETILAWTVAVLAPLCVAWAFWNWEDWRNDLYKLDRERVYHVESLPFGMREQSKETLITRVTDVTYTVPGLLANILNYGDVALKTPGEETQFVFRGIPQPREVQGEIMARVDHYRLKESSGSDREIEAWIKAYHDVRSEGLGA